MGQEKKIRKQIRYVKYEEGRVKAFPFNISRSFYSVDSEGQTSKKRIISLCLVIGDYYKEIVEHYLESFDYLPASLLLGSLPSKEDKSKFTKPKGFDPLAKLVVDEDLFQAYSHDLLKGAEIEVSLTWRQSEYFPGNDFNPEFPTSHQYKGMKIDVLPNFFKIVLNNKRKPNYGEKPYGNIKTNLHL